MVPMAAVDLTPLELVSQFRCTPAPKFDSLPQVASRRFPSAGTLPQGPFMIGTARRWSLRSFQWAVRDLTGSQ